MQMHVVYGIYYLSSGPHTLHLPTPPFFMQIDFEMTFIVWGFRTEACRAQGPSERRKKTKQNKMSTKPATAQFKRWGGRLILKEDTADKQLPQA